jgi:3-methylcrotonyl-CoA carboxylase alpha subunit
MLRLCARPLSSSIAAKQRWNHLSFLARRFLSESPKRPPDIEKVLIANRGEIACRVIRTCRRLNIPTVAVYSVADGPNALHARMADEAFQIGTGPTPSDSYLRQDDLLMIAAQTGAQAIHPGYGFLSENAGFSNRVTGAGLYFVGPGEGAIHAMGSKSHSKAIMEQAGVPTTPGYYNDDNQEAEFLRQQAVEIVGFPLLIKAVMGGGGKGMRLVWKESEFIEALASCQRESQSSFGDDRVLLEKYLVQPRHVEVQVVADSHGNVVHLYERDCSLQRRHQKIIEEAPASDLPPALRQELGDMGKLAARAAGYVNAGTVEFLLDTQEPGKFYFCEMNTRLQVEHPISEMITGIDLVEWQLRIAAGEELPILNQEDIPCRGHAFEARVYAENPARNFLPATGNVWHHNPPAEMNTGASAEGVRVDTGIQPGQDISVYYDPMISKLIVHGETREMALNKLVDALKRYQIAGVPTNIEFLVKCADHATFRKAGAVNTGFLDDHADDVRVEEHALPRPMAQAVGAFASLLHLEKRFGVPGDQAVATGVSPWSSLSGSWRMGGQSGRARRILKLDNDGGDVECVSNRDGSFDIRAAGNGLEDGEWFHVAGAVDRDSNMHVVVNKTQRIAVKTVLQAAEGVIRVRMWPERLDDFFWSMDFKNPLEPAASQADLAASGEGFVKAPMPGRISRVNAAVGDTVQGGEVVMVMEAMKMEHAIKAPRDGILAEIRYKANDLVDDGAVLLVLETEEVGETKAA